MAQATFVSGNPVMADHTPSGAVTAGDVVVVGNKPFVAHRDIAANTLGSLAAGNGIYRGNAALAIAKGVLVYWDDSANEFTTVSSSNKIFGVSVTASTASDQMIDVLHTPGTVG
jgi:predicted RecA/RadA family phage recombinase